MEGNTPMQRLIFIMAIIAAGSIAATNATASDAMPVAQQNALVQRYCAVCHTDAFPNGRLSLEHFDAAHPDPGVAAMMASKLRNKALGASGQPLPDRAIQDALLSALTAEAAGADTWIVNRTHDPVTQAPLLTASFVQEVPAAATSGAGDPDLYRLILTCRVDTREAEMQVAWSPGVPKNGQAMSVTVDGEATLTYNVEGNEQMGNGQAGTSGPGAAVLPSAMPLPDRTLTVGNLFPGETVVFPFDSLIQSVRKSLSACFSGGARNQ